MFLNQDIMMNGHVYSKAFLAAKNEFESYEDKIYAYLRNLASNYKKPLKKFWNFINSKYKRSILPGKMSYDDDHATTDIEKSNLFAKFFSSVYKKYDNTSFMLIRTVTL